MSAVLDFLEQYFFADFPGLKARAALVRAWEQSADMTWQELYVQALGDALVEELPQLSAYNGPDTACPTHAELVYALTTDLEHAANNLRTLNLNSRAFLTELARSMQFRHFLVIDGHNLFTDEYRQILLNLFDHANLRFKTVLIEHKQTFSNVLAHTTGNDSILYASVAAYLLRQFGISLPALKTNGPSRFVQNRLRVLLATPFDVSRERTRLVQLVNELGVRARTRFGLELEPVNPSPGDSASAESILAHADIFIGVVWLGFGSEATETDFTSGETFFAGTETSFAAALEQGSGHDEHALRAVVYRCVRPPRDSLQFNPAAYASVAQFFERARTSAGDDFVCDYDDPDALIADANARLDAWIYNCASDRASELTAQANASVVAGEPSNALVDYAQAIALYRELDQPAQELALRFQIGALHEQFNQHAQAARAWDAALRLARRLHDDSAAAYALQQLGAISFAQARWDDAYSFFTQAIAHLDAPETQAARATAQWALAATLEQIGDRARDAQAWAQAENAYSHARDLFEQLDRNDETGVLLMNLGIVIAAQGRPYEALAVLDQARAWLRQPEHAAAHTQALRHQAGILHQIAELKRGAGDFAQAEAYYRQQRDLAQQLDDAALESDAIQYLGLVAADREQWDDAINYYDQAFARMDGPAHAGTRALVQRHQLSAYEKLGERERAARQYPQAAMAYRSALTCAQALQEREQEANLLFALGRISIEQQAWEEALTDLRRALDIYNRMPDAPKSQVIWDIGRAQRGLKRKQLNNAITHANAVREPTAYQEAYALAQEIGDRQTQAGMLLRLGQLCAEQGAWEDALTRYQSAAVLIPDPDAPALRQEILNAQQFAFRALADTQRASGAIENAEANYARALHIALGKDDKSSAGEIYFLLGTLAAETEAWDKALGNYALALENADTAQRAGVQARQAIAFQNLGDAQRAAGQFDAAASAYTSALERAGAPGDDERAAAILYRIGLLNATLGRWAQALDFYTQAETRLPVHETDVRAALANDRAVALRILKRGQLDAQLAHAQAWHKELQWDDAAAAYRAALELARELDDSTACENTQRALVALYADQAETLRKIELWDKAQDAYRESWRLARAYALEPQTQARQSEMLALSAEQTNALREARDTENAAHAAQKTLRLAQEFGDTDAHADALVTLGALAAARGDWDAAKSFYTQARPFLVSAERSEMLVHLDNELAAAEEQIADSPAPNP